jgi:type VI secretion system secreted protein Hcp
MRAKKLIFSMLVIAIFSWLSHAESSASEAYMRINEGGSEIEGTATRAGYENWHFVAAFGHNLYIPLDPSTGQQAGSRKHNPIRIVKLVDKSSPLLYSALLRGVNLTVEIHFLRTDAQGQFEHFFTVSLENARISSVSPSLIASDQDNQMMEIVNFSYGKITWREETASTETEDSWVSPH